MFQMMVPNNRSEGARLNEKNLLMESKSSTFFFKSVNKMFDDDICNNIENMQMPGIREHPWVSLS